MIHNLRHEWADLSDYFTLALVTYEGRVAMGRKTRGFGKGQLVFPGGKEWHRPSHEVAGVELAPPHISAAEEVHQETGIVISPQALGQVGLIQAFTEDGDERTITICRGEAESEFLQDSDELVDVDWYPIDQIPYTRSPHDYPYWAPAVLAGRAINMFLDMDDVGRIVSGQMAIFDPTGEYPSTNVVINGELAYT